MNLEDFFPEINQIKDPNLRSNTILCLEGAIEKGGWSFQDLNDIPFTLLADIPVTLIQHTRAVTQLSIAAYDIFNREYRQHYTLNRDFIVSGALLHDVGKFLEYKRDGDKFVKSPMGKILRHPFSGAIIAAEYGLPPEVVHIIAVHAHEGDAGYRTPEARIVNHADFMNFEPLKDIYKK